VIRIAIALVLALPALTGAAPQEPAPPSVKKSATTDDIFSGTVTELKDESLTVARSALALQTVKRTFLRDAQTVVEGNLRAKARVTVRYSVDESGQFHALHIIVR
jgi:hypothetical protein